jgi:SAM-dependent methyltransferase
MSIKWWILSAIKPAGKQAFLRSIRGRLLDVGCGNGSPEKIRRNFPELYYVGLDIEPRTGCDEFVLAEPEEFDLPLISRSNSFDAIICCHTIEHCLYPLNVVCGIVGALRTGGRAYFSTPSKSSVHLPSRGGCLNFYDDSTHTTPMPLTLLRSVLEKKGMRVVWYHDKYRPAIPRFFGWLLEPLSRMIGRQIPVLSWAYHGFESVIMAEKL